MVKKASGSVLFLNEEMSDARVRCAQLKAHVKEALELIEKSGHKDEFFEMAGHLVHGIPDTLFKLEKALEAASMSGALMDYEELKESVRPEKAEQLDALAEDVRTRQLKRHSNDKQAGEAIDLALRKTFQEGLADGAYTDKDVQDSVRLLNHVVQKTVSSYRNGTPAGFSGTLSNLGSVVSEFVFALGSSFNQDVKTAGVTVMNPKTAAAELTSIATEFETTGELPIAKVLALNSSLGVEVKTASEYISETEVTPDTFRTLAASMKTSPSRNSLAQELRSIIANSREKVMEGFKKSNPSMSDEALEKAADNWEKHQGKFKNAGHDDFTKKRQQAIDDILRYVHTAAGKVGMKTRRGFEDQLEPVLEMSFERGDAKTASFPEDVSPKFAQEEDPTTMAEFEPQLARFEEGKPADPTSQMSEADAAKWKTEHAKNRDNFKTASRTDDLLANLKAFRDAAHKLDARTQSKDFNDVLGAGYPKYLPSFDQFAEDVSNWLEEAELADATLGAGDRPGHEPGQKVCTYCGANTDGNKSGMCDVCDKRMNGRLTGRPRTAKDEFFKSAGKMESELKELDRLIASFSKLVKDFPEGGYGKSLKTLQDKRAEVASKIGKKTSSANGRWKL
jgi:hypothetical protein